MAIPISDGPDAYTGPDAGGVVEVAPIAPPGAAAVADRRGWLALTTAACGAALALGAVPALALGYSSVQALRYLQELEALQNDFFTRGSIAAMSDGFEPAQANVVHLVARQDWEHMEWFRLARAKYGVAEFGHFYTPNTSVSRPPRTFNFPGPIFDKRANFLAFAVWLKETSIGAYHALAAQSRDKEMAQAIAALAGIESRHAAALREISGQNPLPGAFETPHDPVKVMNRLANYGFKGEALR